MLHPPHSTDPICDTSLFSDPLVLALTNHLRTTPEGTSSTLTNLQAAKIGITCALASALSRLDVPPNSWAPWATAWLTGSDNDLDHAVTALVNVRMQKEHLEAVLQTKVSAASVAADAPEPSDVAAVRTDALRAHAAEMATLAAVILLEGCSDYPPGWGSTQAATGTAFAYWVAMRDSNVSLDITAICHSVVGA